MDLWMCEIRHVLEVFHAFLSGTVLIELICRLSCRRSSLLSEKREWMIFLNGRSVTWLGLTSFVVRVCEVRYDTCVRKLVNQNQQKCCSHSVGAWTWTWLFWFLWLSYNLWIVVVGETDVDRCMLCSEIFHSDVFRVWFNDVVSKSTCAAALEKRLNSDVWKWCRRTCLIFRCCISWSLSVDAWLLTFVDVDGPSGYGQLHYFDTRLSF